MTALILGGTAEARALATAATSAGLSIVSSLAGRVRRPALPVGPVRIGGFGGPDGLFDYLVTERIEAVVDATHPFSATISASAATACADAGIPLLRLARPGWSDRPDAAGWTWVASTAAACAAVPDLGHRPFLTTGRQTLPWYEPLKDRFALVRVVEPLEAGVWPHWEVVLDRGPFQLAAEVELMTDRAVDVLVTKDSGGAYTAAKLDAAGRLGIAVVVIRRPEPPGGVPAVDSVDEAVSWLRR